MGSECVKSEKVSVGSICVGVGRGWGVSVFGSNFNWGVGECDEGGE